MCPIRAEITTHNIGKNCLFLICMINRYWFQTKLLLYIAQFWRFWGKNVIFPYIINQKRNNFIKHFLPVYQEAADIRDVYLYKK